MTVLATHTLLGWKSLIVLQQAVDVPIVTAQTYREHSRLSFPSLRSDATTRKMHLAPVGAVHSALQSILEAMPMTSSLILIHLQVWEHLLGLLSDMHCLWCPSGC